MASVTSLRNISTQETLLIARKIHHIIDKKLDFAEAMADLKKFEQLIEEYGCNYDRSRTGEKRADEVLIDAVDTSVCGTFQVGFSKEDVVKHLRNQLSRLSNNETVSLSFASFIIQLIEALEETSQTKSRKSFAR